MLKISGVHHIAIKAKGEGKFNKMLDFYNRILGFSIIRRWENDGVKCAMVDTGNCILELFSNAECEPEMGPVRHIAFKTENVDEYIETVRREGYEITIEPKDIVINSNPPYPARIGFCIGAAGEEVEFFAER